MRLDKLTTKFQEALSDAQSLALGHDNAYIEPVHLLVAMLRQDDGPRKKPRRSNAPNCRPCTPNSKPPRATRIVFLS